jgi:hypothetical protein
MIYAVMVVCLLVGLYKSTAAFLYVKKLPHGTSKSTAFSISSLFSCLHNEEAEKEFYDLLESILEEAKQNTSKMPALSEKEKIRIALYELNKLQGNNDDIKRYNNDKHHERITNNDKYGKANRMKKERTQLSWPSRIRAGLVGGISTYLWLLLQSDTK